MVKVNINGFEKAGKPLDKTLFIKIGELFKVVRTGSCKTARVGQTVMIGEIDRSGTYGAFILDTGYAYKLPEKEYEVFVEPLEPGRQVILTQE